MGRPFFSWENGDFFLHIFKWIQQRETSMNPIKVLVVDDEPDLEFLIRQKLKKRIRKGDLEFRFAQNGCEAL
jgi:hypothetical protein